MISVDLSNVESIESSNHLYQWDKGQQLEIKGLGVSKAPEIHFGVNGSMLAIVVNSTLSGGIVYADIPNEILMSGKDLRVYVHIDGTTIKNILIPVFKRNMPENYVVDNGNVTWIEEFETEANEITTAKCNEIEAKGTSTLESIPDDYTALSNEVTKARLNASGITYSTLKVRLDAMDAETAGKISTSAVESTLADSTNPVQSKVVKEAVTDLKSDLNTSLKGQLKIPASDWQIATINGETGATASHPYRLTSKFVVLNKGDKLSVVDPDKYMFAVFKYDLDGTYVGITLDKVSEGSILEDNYKYRVVLRSVSENVKIAVDESRQFYYYNSDFIEFVLNKSESGYDFAKGDWVNKGLNANADNSVSYYDRNDRLVCKTMYATDVGTTLKAVEGYELDVFFFKFNSMRAGSGAGYTGFVSEYTFTASDADYFMLMIRRIDNNSISAAESNTVYENTVAVSDLNRSVDDINRSVDDIFNYTAQSNVRNLFPRWWIAGINGWESDFSRKNRLCTPVTNINTDFILINKKPEEYKLQVYYGTESAYVGAKLGQNRYQIKPSELGYSWFRLLVSKIDDSNVTIQDFNIVEIATSNTKIEIPAAMTVDTAIITFIDDDGKTAASRIKAVLENNSVSGTFAVITDKVGTDGFLSVSDLKAYSSSGHDIVSHSATHDPALYKPYNSTSSLGTNLALVTNEQYIDDLKRSRDFMIKYGFNTDTIVYPWGTFPESFNANFNNPDPNDPEVCGAENQANRICSIAEGVGFAYGVNATGQTISTTTINSMYLNRTFIMDSNGLDYYKKIIDHCVLEGSWIIFGSHSGETENLTDSFYDSVVKYAKSKASVKKFSEAIAIKKNVVDISDYVHPNKTLRVGRQGTTTIN